MSVTSYKNLLPLLISLAFITSCGGLQPSEGRGSVKTNSSETSSDKCATNKATLTSFSLAGEVTYEGEIKAIINTKCAWCHSSTAKPGDRHSPYLTTFEQVKAEFGESMKEIQEGKMPPNSATPQLAAGDQAKLQQWKDDGFLLGEALPPPDTKNGVFYENAVQTLLKNECVGCHFAGGQPPALDTYESAKSGAAASLVDINNNSMPKAAPLNTANKDLFKAWIDAGMPFNATGDTPPETVADTSSTDGTPTSSGTTSGSGTSSGSSTATAAKCN